jgi:hypothetical protein
MEDRQMPPVWIGLTVAFASALVTNVAYSLEHDAAAALPPLSPRRPLRSAKLLLGDRRWLAAFGAETAGWLMYVAALRLAPLSLVDTAEADQRPAVLGVIIWLAACGGGAVLLIGVPTRFARAASLGLAAGLLFADGDISAELAGTAGAPPIVEEGVLGPGVDLQVMGDPRGRQLCFQHRSGLGREVLAGP